VTGITQTMEPTWEAGRPEGRTGPGKDPSEDYFLVSFIESSDGFLRCRLTAEIADLMWFSFLIRAAGSPSEDSSAADVSPRGALFYWEIALNHFMAEFEDRLIDNLLNLTQAVTQNELQP